MRRPVAEGLQSEIIHVYDTQLPAEVSLRNQDGEVEAIARRTLTEVVEAIDAGDFTLEAALVMLESMARHHHIETPDGLLTITRPRRSTPSESLREFFLRSGWDHPKNSQAQTQRRRSVNRIGAGRCPDTFGKRDRDFLTVDPLHDDSFCSISLAWLMLYFGISIIKSSFCTIA